MRFFRIIPFIFFILFALVSCGKDGAAETPRKHREIAHFVNRLYASRGARER